MYSIVIRRGSTSSDLERRIALRNLQYNGYLYSWKLCVGMQIKKTDSIKKMLNLSTIITCTLSGLSQLIDVIKAVWNLAVGRLMRISYRKELKQVFIQAFKIFSKGN